MKWLWNKLVAPIRLAQKAYQAEPVAINHAVLAGLTAVAVRFGWNGEDKLAYLTVLVPLVLGAVARAKVSPVAKLDWDDIQSNLGKFGRWIETLPVAFELIPGMDGPRTDGRPQPPDGSPFAPSNVEVNDSMATITAPQEVYDQEVDAIVDPMPQGGILPAKLATAARPSPRKAPVKKATPVKKAPAKKAATRTRQR